MSKHGTRTRYESGCRCRLCRNANTDYKVAWDLKAGRRKYGSAKWEEIRPRAKHPSTTFYKHGCRCGGCREASTKEHRKLQGRKPPNHGKGGYTNYGCRCAVCSEANRAENKRRHALRSAR